MITFGNYSNASPDAMQIFRALCFIGMTEGGEAVA